MIMLLWSLSAVLVSRAPVQPLGHQVSLFEPLEHPVARKRRALQQRGKRHSSNEEDGDLRMASIGEVR